MTRKEQSQGGRDKLGGEDGPANLGRMSIRSEVGEGVQEVMSSPGGQGSPHESIIPGQIAWYLLEGKQKLPCLLQLLLLRQLIPQKRTRKESSVSTSSPITLFICTSTYCSSRELIKYCGPSTSVSSTSMDSADLGWRMQLGL
jgi:hypothetical protein